MEPQETQEQPKGLQKKMRKQLTGKRDDTKLHAAARAGSLDEVLEILNGIGEDELKEFLIKQNQAGETALYSAAEYGHIDVVREMIKYYDPVAASIKAKNGYDAFHIAAKEGDLGMFFLHHFAGLVDLQIFGKIWF